MAVEQHRGGLRHAGNDVAGEVTERGRRPGVKIRVGKSATIGWMGEDVEHVLGVGLGAGNGARGKEGVEIVVEDLYV